MPAAVGVSLVWLYSLLLSIALCGVTLTLGFFHLITVLAILVASLLQLVTLLRGAQ